MKIGNISLSRVKIKSTTYHSYATAPRLTFIFQSEYHSRKRESNTQTSRVQLDAGPLYHDGLSLIAYEYQMIIMYPLSNSINIYIRRVLGKKVPQFRIYLALFVFLTGALASYHRTIKCIALLYHREWEFYIGWIRSDTVDLIKVFLCFVILLRA